MPVSFASLVGLSGIAPGSASFFVHVDISRWKGPELRKEVERSAEGMLMDFTSETMRIAKSTVHIISGDLERSIKVDRPSDVRDNTEAAKGGDLGGVIPTPEKIGSNRIALAVSGTTFYAVYEELLHPYIAPAFASAMGSSRRIIETNRLGDL